MGVFNIGLLHVHLGRCGLTVSIDSFKLDDYRLYCTCPSPNSVCYNQMYVFIVQLLSPILLCSPVNYSTQGSPVLHYLPEFAQTHVHCVNDAIQPSHSLLSPSPPAFNLSQHQDLFHWVHLFAWGGQSIGASVSALLLPVNIQGWFPLALTALISLLSKVLSRVFASTTIQKHHFFGAQPPLWANSHISTWLLEKNRALTIQTFLSKVVSQLFNTLSRFVITFVPRSKCILILWLQSPSAVILEPKNIIYIKLCCSVAKSCPTLCDSMDCCTPGLPDPHSLPVVPSSCPYKII